VINLTTGVGRPASVAAQERRHARALL